MRNHGLAAAVTGEQTVTVLYGDDGEALGFEVRDGAQSGGAIYTYVKNLQGDVVRILDAQGNAVVKYAYDPWGVPTIEGDEDLAAINPCSYRGYYYDEETGYYYLQSRYYDPAIGRFINADTYVSTGRSVLGSNMFSYCKNNPTNHVDATGHDGVSFSVNLLQLLGSALSAIMLGIQSGIASIKAAIASVAIPVICIAAAAVGIAAITWQCRS